MVLKKVRRIRKRSSGLFYQHKTATFPEHVPFPLIETLKPCWRRSARIAKSRFIRLLATARQSICSIGERGPNYQPPRHVGVPHGSGGRRRGVPAMSVLSDYGFDAGHQIVRCLIGGHLRQFCIILASKDLDLCPIRVGQPQLVQGCALPCGAWGLFDMGPPKLRCNGRRRSPPPCPVAPCQDGKAYRGADPCHRLPPAQSSGQDRVG